jgi:hypothetical protein
MEREELFFDTNSVAPSLFIGLGGSGSAIVDRIAHKLQQRWNWEQYRGLMHFFAIDTNVADLERVANVPPGNRLLISDVDKRAYVNQKRGKSHMPEDPYVTQWLPEWYDFRATRGSGAGQIRIESRLSLYYQLERDRGEIAKRLNAAINHAKDHDNPFRRNAPRKFNAFVFGSVAGGTGSGGFLVLAYMLQELIDMAGWIPQVHATLLMPSLFHRQVKGALQPDIDANGYAALKELEHLMKLGYEECEPRSEFHYNPADPARTHVERMPFSFVYVVDLPAQMSIVHYKEAIADALYLQLFSPIIGTQQGEYDNYEKHQKTLAHGYSVHYGSFGCSMLVLPDDDLIEYCALRYTTKAMDSYLTFHLPDRAGEVVNQFAINYDDPRFKSMTEERRAKVIDDKFREFIRYLGRVEVDSDNPEGPFSSIVHRCETRDKKAAALPVEFDRDVEKMVGEAKDTIELHMITPVDITAKNIKVDAEVNDLREEVSHSRSALRGLAEAHKNNIETGNFLRSFFERHKVDPFCQRYFLVGLVEHLQKRVEELDAKLRDYKRYEIDAEGVRNNLKQKKELLFATAEYTLMERLKRRNEDFEEARAAFVRFFNEDLQQGNRLLLELEFSRELFGALIESCNALLDVYRTVTARAAETISAMKRDCDRMLATAEMPSGRSEAAEFVLDVEVLQDFSGKRHWDAYFDEFVGSGEAELAMFDRDAILAAMNDAFAPRIDDKGQRHTPGADEVAAQLRERFMELGRDKLHPLIKGTRAAGTDRTLKGLLIDDALRLEARYYISAQLRKDRSKAEPSEEMINEYIVRKLRFCADKAAVLATVDESLMSDSQVVAATDIFLVGLHDHFAGTSDHSLEPLLDRAASGFTLLDGWWDEKRLVFYKAQLGLPLYFYKRVNGEMRGAYERVRERQQRSYPLHIDGHWEEGLLNLDPMDQQLFEESQQRTVELERFCWAHVTGLIEAGADGDRSWSFEQHSGPLGRGYAEAFKAFVRLDERTKTRLTEAAEAYRVAAVDERPEEVQGQLTTWLKELDDYVWNLEQKKRRRDRDEVTLTNELQQMVKAQLEALKA